MDKNLVGNAGPINIGITPVKKIPINVVRWIIVKYKFENQKVKKYKTIDEMYSDYATFEDKKIRRMLTKKMLGRRCD